MHFDSIATKPIQGANTKKYIQVNTVTHLNTDLDGKTHVMMKIDVKLPHQPTRDTL